jgi:hypothetical protein
VDSNFKGEKMSEEIIVYKNQKEIYEFLKKSNENCLNCEECIEEKCTCITSDYYNMEIAEIDEVNCIHQRKIKKEKDDEEQQETLW